MAYVDFGAILKVNKTIYKARTADMKYMPGECDLFMDKSETGYIIDEAYNSKEKMMEPISGEFYVYAGDRHLLVAFYKYYVTMVSNGKVIDTFETAGIGKKVITFKIKIDTNEIITITIRAIDPKHWGKYIATWDYNNKHYEVIYGIGIDPNTNVYNRIKNNHYDYTKTEIEFIDNWLLNTRTRYVYDTVKEKH